MARNYRNASVTLSAGQAAGTTPVLLSDTGRQALMINPPADCYLALGTGDTSGWPMYGGVPNDITKPDVPSNALYIKGLTAGAIVTIWAS